MAETNVNAVRAIVAEIDPGTFVVIGQGHQASSGVLRQVKRQTTEKQVTVTG